MLKMEDVVAIIKKTPTEAQVNTLARIAFGDGFGMAEQLKVIAAVNNKDRAHDILAEVLKYRMSDEDNRRHVRKALGLED